MVAFISTSVLMLSLSAMLYLMVRALPRVAEEGPAERQTILDRWAHSHLPEKVDNVLNGFLLKFFRRLRVVIMRFDNFLGQRLQNVNGNGNGHGTTLHENGKKPNIDFKEIAGQNKESEVQS